MASKHLMPPSTGGQANPEKRWKTMAPDMDADWTPGLDVSGEIVEVGARVANWKVGERVFYHGNMLRPHGGLTEYAIHKAETLIPHHRFPLHSRQPLHAQRGRPGEPSMTSCGSSQAIPFS